MSPKPKVDLDALAEKCEALKVNHIAETLPEVMEAAARDDVTPIQFLEEVLTRELDRRPSGESPPRSASRGCRPARRWRASIGPSSRGWTGERWRPWLADLITSLEEAEPGRVQHRLKVLTHPALLIVDEIGCLPVTRTGATLFFHLVNRRYEGASTVLTSNKSFDEWAEVFRDAVMAAAPHRPAAPSLPHRQHPGQQLRNAPAHRALAGPPRRTRTQGGADDLRLVPSAEYHICGRRICHFVTRN